MIRVCSTAVTALSILIVVSCCGDFLAAFLASAISAILSCRFAGFNAGWLFRWIVHPIMLAQFAVRITTDIALSLFGARRRAADVGGFLLLFATARAFFQ